MKLLKLRLALSIAFTSLSLGCSLLGNGLVKYEGASMLPGIKDGDRLPIVRLDSRSAETLARGDIIVFRAPSDKSKSYVKRVIGIPGDRIEIRGGEVWLNESKLSEPYVSPNLNQARRSQEMRVVPPQSYYVMGDNRDNSADSRMWGCIPADSVTAKVVGR